MGWRNETGRGGKGRGNVKRWLAGGRAGGRGEKWAGCGEPQPNAGLVVVCGSTIRDYALTATTKQVVHTKLPIRSCLSLVRTCCVNMCKIFHECPQPHDANVASPVHATVGAPKSRLPSSRQDTKHIMSYIYAYAYIGLAHPSSPSRRRSAMSSSSLSFLHLPLILLYFLLQYGGPEAGGGRAAARDGAIGNGADSAGGTVARAAPAEVVPANRCVCVWKGTERATKNKGSSAVW